jgi:hypothetical protein
MFGIFGYLLEIKRKLLPSCLHETPLLRDQISKKKQKKKTKNQKQKSRGGGYRQEDAQEALLTRHTMTGAHMSPRQRP